MHDTSLFINLTYFSDGDKSPKKKKKKDKRSLLLQNLPASTDPWFWLTHRTDLEIACTQHRLLQSRQSPGSVYQKFHT